jgi:chromosome segregation ATPase
MAVAGILIALLVIYFAGKALAWVFSSTEKKVEPEPSIMTELDELRRSNERLSTMYDNLSSQAQSYDRMIRITELEKELSDLRSSCDDSFLNTIERANQLSLKCASLENIIAEFDVYKKDAQEVHDKLTKLYDAEVATKKDLSSKLWRSRREVASLKRDLISATAQIAELGDKYRKVERERNEYESMYNSILVQYAELKVKLNAIEQDKPVINK